MVSNKTWLDVDDTSAGKNTSQHFPTLLKPNYSLTPFQFISGGTRYQVVMTMACTSLARRQ